MDQATLHELLAEIKKTKQELSMMRDAQERWLKELHRRRAAVPLRYMYQEEIREQEARLSCLMWEVPKEALVKCACGHLSLPHDDHDDRYYNKKEDDFQNLFQ